MVDQLTIQTIGVLVAATSVVAFVLNSILTGKREEKRSQLMLETRQNQFMMQLNESMTTVGFWKDLIDLMNMEWTDIDDFEKKWGTGRNADAAAKRLSVWWRYNYVGGLLRKGFVDRQWLFETCGSFCIQQWNKWKSIIEANRKLFNMPDYLRDFEYFSNEMVKVGEERGSRVTVVKNLKEDANLGQLSLND